MSAVIGALRGLLSLDSAAFERGVKRAQASMNGLQRSLARSGDQMRAAGRKMTLGVTLPMAGIATVALRSSLQTIDAQAKMAQSMDTTVKSMQVLSRAADTAGISQGELEGAMTRVTRRLSLAAAGGGPAADALKQLGFAAGELEALPLDERITAIQGAISEMIPVTEQIGIRSKIFGDRLGVLMGRLDAPTIKAAAKEIDRFGVAVSEIDADQIERTNDALSAIGLVSSGLANQLAVAMAPALERVAVAIQNAGTWFASLSPTVQRAIGVAAGLTAALGPVLVVLGLTATALAGLSAPVLAVVAGVGVLVTAGAALAGGMGDLSERFPAVTDAMSRMRGAVRWLGDNMGRVRDVALGLVSPFILLGVAGREAGRFLIDGWDNVRARFPGVAAALDGAASAIGSAFSSMWDGVKSAGAFTVQQLETAGRGIRAAVSGDWTTAFSEARALVSGYVTAFQDIGPGIGDALAAARRTMAAEFRSWNLTGLAISMVSDFIAGLADWGARIVAAAGDAWEAMRAEIAKWAERAKKLAGDVIDGFIEGLKGGERTAWTGGRNLGRGVSKGVEDELEIQSPSRVMAKIGNFVVDGFVAGIDAKAADAVAAATDLAEGVVEGTQDGLSGLSDVIADAFSGTFDSGADALSSLQDFAKDTFRNIVRDAANTNIQLGASGQGGGGILGSLGSFGAAFKGGASSSISAFMSGGFAGGFKAIGTALSGVGGGLAGIGAALGAVAGPIGLAVSAFSMLSKPVTYTKISNGLYLFIDSLDDVRASLYEYGKTEGGILGSANGFDKKFGEAGQAGNEAAAAFSGMVATAQEATRALGVTDSRFQKFFDDYVAANGAMRLKIKDGEDVGQALSGLVSRMVVFGDDADTLTATLERLAIAGEDANTTLVRVATQFQAVSAIMGALGQAGVGSGLNGAATADALVQLFGGLDAFVQATDAYSAAFYTSAEKTALITKDLSAQMDALNVQMPRSRAQFRAMVEAQDLLTESGRATYAALVANAEAFDKILPAAMAFTAEMERAADSLAGALSTGIADVQGLAREAAQAAQLWYRTAETLKNFLRDLKGTDLGGRSPASQLAFNRDQFNAAVAGAKGGDVAAAQAVPGLARAFLESSRATAKSGDDYRFAAAQVTSQVALLGGIAGLEGATQDVMAGLYEQSIVLLTRIAEWNELNGATAEQIAAIADGQSADVAAALGDIDGTIAGFEGQLDELQRAIRGLEDFSYADIQGELSAVVNVAARSDNLPPYLQALIGSEAGEIQRNVDFILRQQDLTPDLLFIAANAASEHVKLLRFAAKTDAVPPELLYLAVTDASDLRKTIRLAAVDNIPADVKQLALSSGGELIRNIRAILDSGSSNTAIALALGNNAEYGVGVKASLVLPVSDAVRRVVLEQTGTYTASIMAALTASNLSEPARRVLLDRQGQYITAITATLAADVDNPTRRLLLDAITTGTRALTLSAIDSGLSAAERRLLLEEEPRLRAEIIAMVNPLGLSGTGLLFLEQFGGPLGTVDRIIKGKIEVPTDLTPRQSLLLAEDLGILYRTVTGLPGWGELTDETRGIVTGQFDDATRILFANVSFAAFGSGLWRDRKLTFTDAQDIAEFTSTIAAYVNFRNLGTGDSAARRLRMIDANSGMFSSTLAAYVDFANLGTGTAVARRLRMIDGGDASFASRLNSYIDFANLGSGDGARRRLRMLDGGNKGFESRLNSFVDFANLGSGTSASRRHRMLDGGNTAFKATLRSDVDMSKIADGTAGDRRRRFIDGDFRNATSTLSALVDMGRLADGSTGSRRRLEFIDATAKKFDSILTASVVSVAGQPTWERLSLLDKIMGAADRRITLAGGIAFDPDDVFASAVMDGADDLKAAFDPVRIALLDLGRNIGTALVPALDDLTAATDNSASASEAAGVASAVAAMASIASGNLSDAQLTAARPVFDGGINNAADAIRYATFHTGGIVGEENITALRGEGVFTQGQMAAMQPAQDSGEIVRELRAMKAELAEMRSEQRQLGIKTLENTKRTATTLKKFDAVGLPAERTA